jgi:hypothetical protein
MRRRDRRTARDLARKHWAEGFYAGLLGGWTEEPLTYSEAPAWYDTVARSAHKAGYAAGDLLRADVVKANADKGPWKLLYASGVASRKPHEPGPEDMAHFMRVAEETR